MHTKAEIRRKKIAWCLRMIALMFAIVFYIVVCYDIKKDANNPEIMGMPPSD